MSCEFFAVNPVFSKACAPLLSSAERSYSTSAFRSPPENASVKLNLADDSAFMGIGVGDQSTLTWIPPVSESRSVEVAFTEEVGAAVAAWPGEAVPTTVGAPG